MGSWTDPTPGLVKVVQSKTSPSARALLTFINCELEDKIQNFQPAKLINYTGNKCEPFPRQFLTMFQGNIIKNTFYTKNTVLLLLVLLPYIPI
jgi:hypothetical protein